MGTGLTAKVWKAKSMKKRSGAPPHSHVIADVGSPSHIPTQPFTESLPSTETMVAPEGFCSDLLQWLDLLRYPSRSLMGSMYQQENKTFGSVEI